MNADIFLFFCFFLDSTPVNGESEQKKDDMSVEEKPKSPFQEDNNGNTASSPNRWTSNVMQYRVLLLYLIFGSHDKDLYDRYTCMLDLSIAMLLLHRRSPDSPADEQTHTYDEADNSISAETEPPAIESWKTFNHQRSGPSAKRWWPLCLTWCSTCGPATLQHTPSISYTICYVNIDVLDILYYTDIKAEGPIAHIVRSIIYHNKNESLLVW